MVERGSEEAGVGSSILPLGISKAKVGICVLKIWSMFEKLFRKEQKEDDSQVSQEELDALKIPRGVTMTRSELDAHLETERRKQALGEKMHQEQVVAHERAESGK